SAEAASPSESANESEQPVVASEPRARESEPKDAPREAPPKTPKVDKDDGPETPTAEDPAKEIGRQAVKKMLKEVKRMQRGLANNDNHGVNEEEVEDVLTNPGEDRPGREGSRVAIGQTRLAGTYERSTFATLNPIACLSLLPMNSAERRFWHIAEDSGRNTD